MLVANCGLTSVEKIILNVSTERKITNICARIKMFITWLCMVILLMMKHCIGWGILSLRLVNYKNPGHTLFNGECCDTLTWCSTNACENYFKFCVTSLGSLHPCNLGSSETRVLGDDDFTFPKVGGSLGTNLLNPLTFNFSHWQGSTVVIEVWDDDSGHIAGSLHDFVDKYTLTLSQLRSADPDLQSATQQTKKLCGKRSCMTVTVTLYCGPNYLVPECRTYCMSHNDSLGHYNCNYTAGRKICHDGWYDPLSDCVKKRKICTPRNDSLGHYNCDPVSGEKLCLSGWTGENCTQICLGSPCPHSGILRSTSKHILERSSSHLAALKTKIKPTTEKQMQSTTSSANEGYLTSIFPAGQSTAFSYSISFVTLILRTSFETEHNSLLLKTMKTVSLSHNISIPQSLISTSKISSSSSSSSLVKTSKSLKMRLSLSSPLFQESIHHVTPLFLTPTAAGCVDKSSVLAGPTEFHPTDGIAVEMKPYHNWTTERKRRLEVALVNKINEYCAKHVTLCMITPNMTDNRALLNMSHIIMKITNSSVGKFWVRLKVKLPINLSQKPGYLPSNVLRTIVLENKDSLERNIGAEIVTVHEVTWDSPNLTTERSTIKIVTVLPTTLQGSLQEYSTSFLPYVLGAFCLTAAFIVGFVFYRRTKLRETRIQPQTTSNKSEEELIILSSRKTSTSTRPRSAPNDTKRTDSNQTDLKSLDDQPENYRRSRYRFSSESDLRVLIQPDSKFCNDDETEDTSPGNALFLTKSRLRELTKVST